MRAEIKRSEPLHGSWYSDAPPPMPPLSLSQSLTLSLSLSVSLSLSLSVSQSCWSREDVTGAGSNILTLRLWMHQSVKFLDLSLSKSRCQSVCESSLDQRTCSSVWI